MKTQGEQLYPLPPRPASPWNPQPLFKFLVMMFAVKSRAPVMMLWITPSLVQHLPLLTRKFYKHLLIRRAIITQRKLLVLYRLPIFRNFPIPDTFQFFKSQYFIPMPMFLTLTLHKHNTVQHCFVYYINT